MTDANELCRMDTVTLARRIRAKELSPVKVIEAVLGRLERLDPVLHAFTTVTADDARAEARRIKQDIAAGREVGPLAGVPTGVKDLICTKGVRTASGCYAYADFVPDEDDVVVERINAAGAIVIGKTQVPEFGYSGTGQTPLAEPTANPWRLDRTSGGSSAGSARRWRLGLARFRSAATAAGRSAFGELLRPMRCQGDDGPGAAVSGYQGRALPGVSSWESLEHIGPITRTVADAALVLSVIAGPDDRGRLSLPAADFDWRAAAEGAIAGMRVAYSPDLGYAAVDPQVARSSTRPCRSSSVTSAAPSSTRTQAGPTRTRRCGVW
jgi:aspartyl-tRNA(Asn)/glutamyl-tRNA(Gln) amidotransferase subunit A